MMQVVIIDTQCANISSVKFALERLGHNPLVTSQREEIKQAEKVILPGVGTAKAAMKNIEQLELAGVISGLEQPVLGICLGMQLLAQFSEEGNVDCLGLIDSEVRPMSSDNVRLPHMGWNQLTAIAEHPLFQGITTEDYFYFVHSFCVPVGHWTLAQCEYGQKFSASIARDNFMGVQFHPERSGKSGATLLKNFMEMKALC